MMCITLSSYGTQIVVRCIRLGWVDENRPTDNRGITSHYFQNAERRYVGGYTSFFNKSIIDTSNRHFKTHYFQLAYTIPSDDHPLLSPP